MAFDQATRNRLQKFVSDARKLLSEEFTQQLQNTYGLDPINGGVSDMSDLPSLSPSEQQTATLLRDTLDHYLAASGKVNPHLDKTLIVAALDRIVREQAFTVLNRLAALRMAEARQFVMESISEGYQSKGFQLYQRIAGSSLGETGQAYQTYLFSIFDELSLDLSVLFDRYSAQGRLFPRETVLIELLELINHAELGLLWVEDETVGWIYQYFNSKEERKKMRDESQAPRNSRELAVRNQFFTPRYVVEFLTDNTLGRIWYEMTKGKTTLVDSCQYLVRRPNEVFLDKNQAAPTENNDDDANLSQDELLQRTVFISHRALKDPRDIRMLDPACGSMHFGLYAFDLFETIYSEAWDFESGLDDEHALRQKSRIERKSLHDSYASKEDFLADVPRLIIEHNIHGVDIDPRAAQIAGLSLWLRAQKSWADNDIKPVNRPQIQRSNIVCAEPMPGEKELLKDFTSQIQPRVLGQLVEEIFEKMELAGEAGTLLKIEEEIQSAIEEAKAQKDENVLEVQGGLFGDNQWETREGKRYYNFGDVSDDFWEEAEQLILKQLERYAELAAGTGSGQKRLFAADAAKGFAFIDLCRKKFDVVLMNPPFGEYSEMYKTLSKKSYSSGGHDILTAFVERGVEFLITRGRLGAITSRTPFYAPTTKKWRQEIVLPHQVDTWIDLGEGVLDDALVETCTYTIERNIPSYPSIFYSGKEIITTHNEGEELLEYGRSLNYLNQNVFLAIDGAPFSYWIRPSLLKAVKKYPPLSASGVDVKVGLQTGDDFRFIRSWWEVPKNTQVEWLPHAKGGENQPFYTDVYMVVNWKEQGREIKSTSSSRLNAYSRVDPSIITDLGLTFPYRTHRFSPALIEPGVVTGVAGMGIYSETIDISALSALFNSSIVNELIKIRLTRRDLAPLYQAGTISPIPLPSIPVNQECRLKELNNKIVKILRLYFSFDETTVEYQSIFKAFRYLELESLSEVDIKWKHYREEIRSSFEEIDSIAGRLYGLDENESNNIHYENLTDFYSVIPETLFDKEKFLLKVYSYFVGVYFGRWSGNDEIRSYPEIADSEELFSAITNGSNKYENKFPDIIGEIKTDYFVRTSGFFNDHLKTYSKGRRQAPIYWPLQSRSGLISIWVYYPKINDQTLFMCINNYVDPKINNIKNEISALQSENQLSNEYGMDLNILKAQEQELKNFRDDLLNAAMDWAPNSSDGVQLNAAPIYNLFNHTAWRKKLKNIWSDLEFGKFDWAKTALNYWPERVLKKCHQDRSIAIAHDVESDLWEEVEVQVGKTKKTKLVWQPKEMTSAELDTYIQQKIAQG